MRTHDIKLHDGLVAALLFSAVALGIYRLFWDPTAERTAAGQVSVMHRQRHAEQRAKRFIRQAETDDEADPENDDNMDKVPVASSDQQPPAVVPEIQTRPRQPVRQLPRSSDELELMMPTRTRQRAPINVTPSRPQKQPAPDPEREYFRSPEQQLPEQPHRQRAPPPDTHRMATQHQDSSAPTADYVPPVRLAPIPTAEDRLMRMTGVSR